MKTMSNSKIAQGFPKQERNKEKDSVLIKSDLLGHEWKERFRLHSARETAVVEETAVRDAK